MLNTRCHHQLPARARRTHAMDLLGQRDNANNTMTAGAGNQATGLLVLVFKPGQQIVHRAIHTLDDLRSDLALQLAVMRFEIF